MLEMIKDQSGQTSSMRIGKLMMLAMWMFQSVMHILQPDVTPSPDIIMTGAVLTMFGIGAGQKLAEKKKQE